MHRWIFRNRCPGKTYERIAGSIEGVCPHERLHGFGDEITIISEESQSVSGIKLKERAGWS
jgi:hypothetical protein